jgi:hypothetical protein
VWGRTFGGITITISIRIANILTNSFSFEGIDSFKRQIHATGGIAYRTCSFSGTLRRLFIAWSELRRLTSLESIVDIDISFFKTLVDHQVTVELKNDISIRGTLKSVDQFLMISP